MLCSCVWHDDPLLYVSFTSSWSAYLSFQTMNETFLLPRKLLQYPLVWPFLACSFVRKQRGTLNQTLEGLQTQERYPDMSNEDLHNSTYRILAIIFEECGHIFSMQESVKIASNCSLFPHPLSADKTKADFIPPLRSPGITFSTKATNTSGNFNI